MRKKVRISKTTLMKSIVDINWNADMHITLQYGSFFSKEFFKECIYLS